jgi:hypothetical protein
MIGSYLHKVFINCKSLQQTEHYNFEILESFFLSHFQELLQSMNFQNESDFVVLCTSKKYGEISQLIENDKLLKIFYLINSFGEYADSSDNFDDLERYKFAKSIQRKLGITENLVLNLIHESIQFNPILSDSFQVNNHKSYFYLSHDIDSIYGSLKQDGLWAIKNLKFDVMFNLFFKTITSKPEWFNFDLIMKTESEYDFKSTFYWLVNKGRIDARQTNADYSISSKSIISEIVKIDRNGFENGLHKSISNERISEEIVKMPVSVVGNRYHYLKFKIPEAYKEIEKSGLKLDASLGFAEHYGFRNSYGYPFQPYNIETENNFSFLEVPLNVMDGTLQRYLKIPVNKTADTVIDFLELNKENSLISILWHNTFFSNYKYKGYLQEYKKILAYLYEMKFENINQNEIIDQFKWKV